MKKKSYDPAYYSCAMCGSQDGLTLQPSRGQLFFGGFPVRLEHRCPKCERQVARAVKRALKHL